jgi:hypothetical protein
MWTSFLPSSPPSILLQLMIWRGAGHAMIPRFAPSDLVAHYGSELWGFEATSFTRRRVLYDSVKKFSIAFHGKAGAGSGRRGYGNALLGRRRMRLDWEANARQR